MRAGAALRLPSLSSYLLPLAFYLLAPVAKWVEHLAQLRIN
jgi:hypothetical protein